MKRKVAIVVTARASYAKYKSLLHYLNKDKNCDLIIVAAASMNSVKFGLASEIIENDGFTVHYRIETLIENDSLLGSTKTSSNTLNDCAFIFSVEKPDVVVVMGDRYEVLPVSIAATYQNIPLAHIQGGEITGNIDEKVRHAITKLADYHFVSNSDAYKNVFQLGEKEDVIFNVGCPSIDVAKSAVEEEFEIDFEDFVGVGHQIKLNEDFNIVMFHPETERIKKIKENTISLCEAIKKTKIQTIWFWPNSDPGNEIITKVIRSYREKKNLDNCFFIKSLPPVVFLKLLSKCSCLIGNSSAGIRESNFLGTPTINLGIRQSGRLQGENVTNFNFLSDKNLSYIILDSMKKNFKSGKLYGDGNAGQKIGKKLMKEKLFFTKKFISRNLK